MSFCLLFVGCIIEVISPACFYVISYIISTALCIQCIVYNGIPPALYIALCISNTILLIGIPMSVCLHRYFSHGAFETSRFMQFCLGIIACLAFQGGPLQWAENHKKHHIFCDLPNDVHSIKQHGFWYSFLGWMGNPANYKSNYSDYMYINSSMRTWELIVVQKFNCLPCIGLCYIIFYIFGVVCMMWTVLGPMLLCRTITLLFNVEFHPINASEKCLAVDNGRILAKLVGESLHQIHHVHPRKARRSDIDIPYWLTLHWMNALGIIWNLK
jgi:stearoyl-CoA desaturase (delta-9 desaturase)